MNSSVFTNKTIITPISKLLIFISIFLCFSSLNAQHELGVDTLDTKGKLNFKLNNALKLQDFNQVLEIAESICIYGVHKKDPSFEAYGYDVKAEVYAFQNNIPLAKKFTLKKLSINKALNNYSQMVISESSYAKLLREEGQLDSSFYILNKASKHVSDTISKASIKFFYNQKETSFLSAGRVDSTLHYIFKRLQLVKKDNHYELSNTFLQLASTLYKVYDYDKALIYINKSLETLHKSSGNYPRSILKSRLAKARVLLDLKQYDASETEAFKILEVLKERPSENTFFSVQTFLARLYWNTNKKDQANAIMDTLLSTNKGISNDNLFNFYLNKLEFSQNVLDWKSSLNALNELDTLKRQISNLNSKRHYYKLAAKHWSAVKAFEKSTIAQQKYTSISEQINNRQQTYAVYDLEKKYETAEKDKELLAKNLQLSQQNIAIEENKNQTRIAWFIAAILAIASLGIFFIYKQRQTLKNNEIEVLKTKQELLRLESLIEGEEKERKRLAQDLHDGINGDLSVIKYKITSIDDSKLDLKEKKDHVKAVSMLDNAIEQVRHISHNLAPPSLQNFTLLEAVKQFCTNISESNAVAVDFQYYGNFAILKNTTETALYRIIQEGLNNIIKHAKATQAIVQLTIDNSVIHVTIEDNGVGFDYKQQIKGLGLNTIASRVKYLNGEVDIDSNKNGTLIDIRIEHKKIT